MSLAAIAPLTSFVVAGVGKETSCDWARACPADKIATDSTDRRATASLECGNGACLESFITCTLKQKRFF
jgi:hypothetical protein